MTGHDCLRCETEDEPATGKDEGLAGSGVVGNWGSEDGVRVGDDGTGPESDGEPQAGIGV